MSQNSQAQEEPIPLPEDIDCKYSVLLVAGYHVMLRTFTPLYYDNKTLISELEGMKITSKTVDDAANRRIQYLKGKFKIIDNVPDERISVKLTNPIFLIASLFLFLGTAVYINETPPLRLQLIQLWNTSGPFLAFGALAFFFILILWYRGKRKRRGKIA